MILSQDNLREILVHESQCWVETHVSDAVVALANTRIVNNRMFFCMEEKNPPKKNALHGHMMGEELSGTTCQARLALFTAILTLIDRGESLTPALPSHKAIDIR
jgi:hypothetical protein